MLVFATSAGLARPGCKIYMDSMKTSCACARMYACRTKGPSFSLGSSCLGCACFISLLSRAHSQAVLTATGQANCGSSELSRKLQEGLLESCYACKVGIEFESGTSHPGVQTSVIQGHAWQLPCGALLHPNSTAAHAGQGLQSQVMNSLNPAGSWALCPAGGIRLLRWAGTAARASFAARHVVFFASTVCATAQRSSATHHPKPW